MGECRCGVCSLGLLVVVVVVVVDEGGLFACLEGKYRG